MNNTSLGKKINSVNLRGLLALVKHIRSQPEFEFTKGLDTTALCWEKRERTGRQNNYIYSFNSGTRSVWSKYFLQKKWNMFVFIFCQEQFRVDNSICMYFLLNKGQTV